MTEYLVLFGLVLFIASLFGFLVTWGGSSKKSHNLQKAAQTRKKAAAQGLLVNCPLCKSALLPGEDLVSRVYRPMTVPDQLCTISGCPHCYPAVQAGLKRECPVCGKTVPLPDGHLVARLFNKTDGKKHVVVTGCTECCRHPIH